MPITPTGYHHVRLTVTDLARSRAFYEGVFGLEVAYELPPDADQQTREALWFLFGGVIYRFGDHLLGLRPVGADAFSEDRTGLDHVSLTVGSRADLDAAVAVLEERGVAHSGVKDLGVGCILEFRDPDGIALELWSPPA